MPQKLCSVKLQGGQAMVEFVVAGLFFLVPLFLAITAIGKMVDVQHTTDMASRYAAWERTVWYDASDKSTLFKDINNPNQKTTTQIKNEIAVRILNDHSSPVTVIKNTDKSASTFVNGIDPMWQDAAGTAYLDKYEQLSLSISNEAPQKDIAGKGLKILADMSTLISAITDKSIIPPVPLENLAVAHVTIKDVAKSSESYKRLWPDMTWAGFNFESTSAVLSNTWSANSSQGTKNMVAQSVPGATGSILNSGLKAVKVGILSWDPIAGSDIEVGKIAEDEVPNDRLK